MSKSKQIRGTCEDLCPENEVKLRIKERLLHFYELKSGNKNVPGILVKSFSRSAAGCRAPRAKDLRTQPALQRTLEYLLKDVISDKRKPYYFVYDFIFDRLRAVRQEIVMQNFNARQTIQLLEPMIMFLAYSRYRLCTESQDKFDKKICDQHLQECLKRVLCCYDEITEYNEEKLQSINSRICMESIYQIFNLGSADALDRCIRLPLHIRNNLDFRLAHSMAINYFQGNYFRVLIAIKNFPHILSAVASLKLQHIRCRMLKMFSHAYNSKILSVPISWLRHLLLYSLENDVVNDCKHYNIAILPETQSVKFFKTDFQISNELFKETHEAFVEDKLKNIYLPQVLQLKKL